MTDISIVRERYRRFAEQECRGYSDLYYRLATGVADSNQIVRFIADRPAIQPNLFFAAIQFITGPGDMPSTAEDIATLLRRRGDEVAGLMRTRRTQTNEVGRTSVLLPALPPGPIALLEVGASAGLNLLLDDFFHDYGPIAAGRAGSPVRLSCRLRGDRVPRLAHSRILWRRGLDVAPVDLHDKTSADWLLACVWADHRARRERLEQAIGLWREKPPSVIKGDLVDDLRRVVHTAPSDVPLVVIHTAVYPYVAPERREAFTSILRELARHRDVVRISCESPDVVPDVRVPATGPVARFMLLRTMLSGATPQTELLATAHPHGADMTWLGATC